MTLLREYTVAVRDLLGGGTVTADGRYVRLDQVRLDWPPEQVPPLLVGARGPRTLRLAGELADGVILDTADTAADVRAARELLAEGRAAAGRDGATQVTVFTELDVAAEPLATRRTRLLERAAELGAAGADSVVFHGTGTHPDPVPYIEALAVTTLSSRSRRWSRPPDGTAAGTGWPGSG